MSVDPPTPRRRPPPRPPKPSLFLNKEADLHSNKQAAPTPPSIAYPKGKNPFGESSDDDDDDDDDEESSENGLPLEHSPSRTNALPQNVGSNPFDDFVSDDDQEEIKPSKSVIGSEAQRIFHIGEVNDGEIYVNNSVGNITFSSDEADNPEVKYSPPPNPFDAFSEDESEMIKIDNVPKFQIPPKPPRKRLAPKPPVLRSADGLSTDHSMRLSLQAVNEASSSPCPLQKFLSASSESVQRPKGPAPPQPVGPKREIRAEGFVKYPKLRREIEEATGKLLQIDEEITALNEKIEQARDDEVRTKKYSKKMAKLMEKREQISARHHQLINRLQEQMLEDRHADLEFELRNILAKQEHLRTEEENKRSEELLSLLMEIVAERDRLVEERNSPEKNLPQHRQSPATPEPQFNDNHSGDDVIRSG